MLDNIVALFMSAWIEIRRTIDGSLAVIVALFMSAWIEISNHVKFFTQLSVALYMNRSKSKGATRELFH